MTTSENTDKTEDTGTVKPDNHYGDSTPQIAADVTVEAAAAVKPTVVKKPDSNHYGDSEPK